MALMALIWKRERDGEHNGKPCYEYSAASEDREVEFFIVWAYDRGGSFGFTAVRRDPKKPGTVEYLTERNGIQWSRTLTRCKAECEKINERYQNGK
jgi:hypothetical protein